MSIGIASEPLSKLLDPYPKANDKVTQQLSKDFDNIRDKEFENVKNRICVFKELIALLKKKNLGLDKQARLELLGAVLEGGGEQAKAAVKGPSGANKWSAGMRTVLKVFSSGDTDTGSIVDDLLRRATQAAKEVTDNEFLSGVEQYEEKHTKHFPQLVALAERARRRAFECLEGNIARTLKKLVPVVHRIQEDKCRERIKREHTKRAEEEQNKLRVDLIKDVNDLSAQTTHSCVSKPFFMIDRDKVDVVACRHTLSIDNVEEHRKDAYYGKRQSRAFS